SWGNLRQGPFAPEDSELRRASPVPSYHYLESNVVSVNKASHNGAPTTTRASLPESNLPVNPFLIPATLAVTTLAKSGSRFYELLEVEAEALVDTAPITAPNLHRAEVQELPSTQATNVSAHVTSTTQRSSTAIAAYQPAEGQHFRATKVSAKLEKRQVEGQNKWWEMGGNLHDTKRHLRREAVDLGDPNTAYRNAQQIAHQSHALKRGRANKRRDRPQERHSPKVLRGPTPSAEDQPIVSRDSTERGPGPIGASLSNFHKRDSKFIETFEAPHQPVGRFDDEGNSTRRSAARRPASTTRHPLGSLDINVELGGGSQELHQADAVQDSEDGGSPLDDNAEPDSSWWLGKRIFFWSQSTGPDQL
ncbi:hypothetical protein FRC00_007617, partial [Tulasnella sp. 408]